MMATTIMISTSVKPALLFVLICMSNLSVVFCSNARRELRKRRVIYYYLICSRIAFCNRALNLSKLDAMVTFVKNKAELKGTGCQRRCIVSEHANAVLSLAPKRTKQRWLAGLRGPFFRRSAH